MSQIREVILCKYGEIVLKGANRQNFESMLVKELRRRASPHGIFKIYFNQSTIYVEPQNDECDMDAMYETAKHVFGIIGVNRAKACEKTMESIIATAKEYFAPTLTISREIIAKADRSIRKLSIKLALPLRVTRLTSERRTKAERHIKVILCKVGLKVITPSYSLSRSPSSPCSANFAR